MKWVGNKIHFFLTGGFPLKYFVNGWTVSSLILAILILAPIISLFLGFFKGPGESWNHILSTVLGVYTVNTLILIIGVGSITVLIGVSLAWFTANYNFPGKRFFEWALILPLAIPAYIMAFTYVGILDYTGSLKQLIGGAWPGFDIMNIWGAIVIMSMVLYPYVYLLTRASFLYQSVNVIEASRTLGKSPLKTLLKVAIPVSRPAIIGGLSLVIFEVLNDYGAVMYYGIPTFTTGIFRAWFSLGEIQTAIYLAVILLLFVILLLAIEKYQRRNITFEFGASARKLIPVGLSKRKGLLITGCCTLVFVFAFVLPFIQLIIWSAQTSSNYINDSFYLLIYRSLYVALIAAFLAMVIAFLYHYCSRNFKSLSVKLLTRISSLGYAIPGAVIGVGILIFILPIDKSLTQFIKHNVNSKSGLIITGSIVALIFGYLVRFLSVAYNSIDSGFKKIHTSIESASRSLGTSNFRTAFKVDAPMIRGAFFSGMILVFVDIMKELPITLILRPFNFHTLATKTFELASDERVQESANSAILIILAGIIPVIVLNRLSSPKKSIQE